jgi:two-component system sensor histidine kinase/response regulator
MIDFKHCFTKPITEEVLLGLVPSAIPKAKFIEEKPFLARRILLVEDNTINQLVGVRLLESLGAEVDVAENGYVALSDIN